jgi:[glutamine synthetase] adenylyltransferase / [glutamine synthetase]-adenylyl-L-tyrosine phosphorylase
MRRRMETHNRPASVWDIKQIPGGLVDVEFIAQYLMLLHAAHHPEILHSNTGKALRTLARLGLIGADEARVLVRAGRLWRGLQGYLRLTTGGGFDEAHASEPLRVNLARVGGARDFAELEKKMAETAERVRLTYDKIVLAAAPRDVAATEAKSEGGTP